ncbi:MAG: glutamine synthetase type III [Clostridiales bacterium]|nr:glutamine synthetase type III [Clostridiales bacterium]
MSNLTKTFGSMVFNDAVMKERLPRETYKALKKTINEGRALDLDVANVVANAMKDWAVEHGVTHYTHWFQPMTGITAEKHDGFMTTRDDGIIMEFSGKELIKGEPDASSFPSGGLRATFEARGYTTWDPTSYAFIKEGVLCIPTAFCSYGGEALDKKTPLLRSMQVISAQALRIVKCFGMDDVTSVTTTVGPEQEYFLVDTELVKKRKDLMFTGRTLFGARSPKGQELEDHYFGSIKPRVKAFMTELDDELYKLGIPAKTEHNEAAPAQHELAPIYEVTNVATDHNQLTMDLMKKVALRHGLTCLLHEKPFAGVNGSGKHNNWSLATNTGVNLLDPGKRPEENTRFLLFIAAVAEAVDMFQGLLRVTVASAGNDHRLGANEAPPAIVSIFLGSEITAILEAIESGSEYKRHTSHDMDMGVAVLPHFAQDTADRNRTSPLAFTGNKFEFRMVGSAFSVAEPNIIINTIVADVLEKYADILEQAEDVEKAALEIIRNTIRTHKRIIFNGNNYSDEWVEEAKQRGLLNLRSTPEALEYYVTPNNISVFVRHGIFTEAEVRSRYEILMENYSKVLSIEAMTMLEMAKREIMPAVSSYLKELSQELSLKKSVCPDADDTAETALIMKISALLGSMYKKTCLLDEAVINSKACKGAGELAHYYHDSIFSAMQELRAVADELELICAEKYWPFPTYGELLFSV